MEELYPVLKRDYPLNEKNLAFWVNEKESPYTEVKRFDWYRGYQVGGRSLMWGRQSYRWSDFDFEANARDGIAIDWPVRYADLAPWYDHVERHAGIAGSRRRNGAASGRPVPARDAAQLRRGARRRSPDEVVRRASAASSRVAPRTPRRRCRDGSPCQYRDACWLGCPYGALLQHAVIDAAGRHEDRPPNAQAVLDRQ